MHFNYSKVTQRSVKKWKRAQFRALSQLLALPVDKPISADAADLFLYHTCYYGIPTEVPVMLRKKKKKEK